MKNLTKTVEHENENSIASMYTRFPQQCLAQPTYLSLHGNNETLRLWTSSAIGSHMTFDNYNQIELIWEVPNNLKKEVYGYILDAVEKPARELINEFESEWDGSNWKGSWGENQESLYEKIQAIINGHGYLENQVSIYESYMELYDANWKDFLDDVNKDSLDEEYVVGETLENCVEYADYFVDRLNEIQKEDAQEYVTILNNKFNAGITWDDEEEEWTR